MPDGNCEALFPNEEPLPPAGNVDGEEGSRPALGLEAPLDGS
jgi:hypothetical protein